MNSLCVVSCGKQKIWDKNPKIKSIKSKDLYIGPFTRKCVEYAEKSYKNSYYILSAKYGFLHPEEVIKAPYNECFHQKGSNPITKDALKFQIKIKKLDNIDKIVVLGGKYYNELIKDLFQKEVINPLDNYKSIGKKMKRLNELLNQRI